MNMKLSKPVIWFYAFFLVYFITYIGEKTTVKYMGIVIFQCYLFWNYQKIKIKKLNKKLLQSISLFVISIFISLIINFNISGMLKVFSLINLYVLVWLMSMTNINKFHIDEDKILSIITNSLLATLIIAFLTHYNDVIVPIGRSSDAGVRHLFGFGVPSIVGFLCFIEFSLSFYLINRKNKNKIDILKSIFKMTISIYMIILADIRSAMVSIIILLLLFYFYKFLKDKGNNIIKTMIILIMLLFFSFFILIGFSNIKSLDYLLSGRLFYYKKAILEIITTRNTILFGVGSFRNSEVELLNKVQIDNSFLDIFYQYGLISLILSIVLMFVIFYLIRKKSREEIEKKCNNMQYGNFINTYFCSVVIYSMAEKNLFSLSSALSLVTFFLVFEYIEK